MKSNQWEQKLFRMFVKNTVRIKLNKLWEQKVLVYEIETDVFAKRI